MNRYPLTWVVVADSARARFFEWASPSAALEEIADPTNPEGRLKERDLSSDRPGLASSAQGHNSGHPMQAAHSGHDKAASAFAREIALALADGLDAGKYAQLMLYAPPQFLGNLRSCLNPRVAKIVVESVPLDLTREDAQAISSRLPPLKPIP